MKLNCLFYNVVLYEKKGNLQLNLFLLFFLQENEFKKEKGIKYGKFMEFIDYKD